MTVSDQRIIDTIAGALSDMDGGTRLIWHTKCAEAILTALKAQRIAVVELPGPTGTTERGDVRWPAGTFPVWTTSAGVNIGGIERDPQSARAVAAAILAAAEAADAAEESK